MTAPSYPSAVNLVPADKLKTLSALIDASTGDPQGATRTLGALLREGGDIGRFGTGFKSVLPMSAHLSQSSNLVVIDGQHRVTALSHWPEREAEPQRVLAGETSFITWGATRLSERLAWTGQNPVKAPQTLPPSLRRSRSTPKAVDSSTTRSARGQGREQDAAVRRAVEQHAVAMARTLYEESGFVVTELGKPYDLQAVRAGEERHVEVKGSRSRIEAVELTVNEVEHARTCVTDLVVVDQITCTTGPDGPTTSGGHLRILRDWRPDDRDLAPTTFRYQLPAPMRRIPGGR